MPRAVTAVSVWTADTGPAVRQHNGTTSTQQGGRVAHACSTPRRKRDWPARCPGPGSPGTQDTPRRKDPVRVGEQLPGVLGGQQIHDERRDDAISTGGGQGKREGTVDAHHAGPGRPPRQPCGCDPAHPRAHVEPEVAGLDPHTFVSKSRANRPVCNPPRPDGQLRRVDHRRSAAPTLAPRRPAGCLGSRPMRS